MSANTTTFEPNLVATTGSLAGDHLWSNPANWSNGLPVDGGSVVIPATIGGNSDDDLQNVSLASLTIDGELIVTGRALNVGDLFLNVEAALVAGDPADPSITGVTVTFGTISNEPAFISVRPGSTIIDNDTDYQSGSISNYAVYGTFVFAGAISGGSVFFQGDSGRIVLENPAPIFDLPLPPYVPVYADVDAQSGDIIEVPGSAVVSVTCADALLTISTNLGTTTFVTDIETLGSYSAAVDPVTGLEAITLLDVTEYGAACYARGTGIATPSGDVPIEELRIGDRVLTASGRIVPIRWIGRRHLVLARHPTPDRVRPIRIRANAFADSAPRRDLFLSPDHAVLRDGMLIPARLLLNGASIQRDTACQAVTYYHIELDRHDILLAENLPAESYLDTGNRALFETGAGSPLMLNASLANDQARREAGSCAPFADDVARVKPIWQALAARAVQLGLELPPAPQTTDDPDLCLLVDGRRLAPVSVAQGRHVFALPNTDTAVRLMSRSTVPSETAPWRSDDRRLGILLRGLTIWSGTSVLPVPLDHPAFGQGWWQPEWHSPTALRRWTNGNALVPMPDAKLMEAGAAHLLEVAVAATLAYPVSAAHGARAERLTDDVMHAAV